MNLNNVVYEGRFAIKKHVWQYVHGVKDKHELCVHDVNGFISVTEENNGFAVWCNFPKVKNAQPIFWSKQSTPAAALEFAVPAVVRFRANESILPAYDPDLTQAIHELVRSILPTVELETEDAE